MWMRSNRDADEIYRKCDWDQAKMWMRSSRVWKDLSELWMRSSQYVDEITEMWMWSIRVVNEIKPLCGWDLAEMFMRSIRVADAFYPSCGWDLDKWAWDLQPSVDEIWTSCGWDLAQCFDRLYVSACQSRSIPGFNPNILRQSGIWGAANEAVFNKVHEKSPQNHLYFIFFYGYFTCMVEARRCDLGEWVKFPGKIKKGGVFIPDDNITW